MLAEDQDELHDVAIHWPRNARRLATILKTGRCPSYSVPRKLRTPGGLVALVDGEGRVMLLFRVARIEPSEGVVAPDGERFDHGYYLVARRGTIRRPKGRDPAYLDVNRHALGAYAYFDESWERVIYDPTNRADSAEVVLAPGRRPFPVRSYPFFANNIDKTLQQPERALIHAYASWIGDIQKFVHHALPEAGLYTDIFIPRCWTLIEAKASTDRPKLREAIGQLFDYQRHYNRSPRLCVLVPERPAASMLDLFEKKRIAVVWQTPSGQFRDSVDGFFTTELRRIATGHLEG